MYTLTKLIQSLISLGNDNARSKELEQENENSKKEITSIRLKPQTRSYLQAQSEVLGISVSQVINLIIDGVVEIESQPQKNKINSIYERITTVFESHNITPLDMSRMLKKYGVTLSKLKSEDAILDLITPEMLNDIASWFGVNIKWLDGTHADIYYHRNLTWYKNPEGLATTILSRRITHGSINIFIIKRHGLDFHVAEQNDDNKNQLDIGFILSYPQEIDGISFDKYEVCEFQRWNYDKCRDDLKLIFKFLHDLSEATSRVSFTGISLDDNLIEKLRSGRVLPAQIRKTLYRGGIWYPEDMTSGIESRYENKDFNKYIEAYTNSPYKRFEYTPDSQDGRIWNFTVNNKGEKQKGFSSLHNALLEAYNLYHLSNRD
ncbi:TPA: conjugal transfer protein TraE [Proteus mirabilis]|uniref:conjugal transfer protein TraE n=1 Tax=Proteus mirabilis TaxID=584 RepID=UPI000D74E384|nr:conjugal transfer protein TraE [Proteus mirabilis]AWR60255.1 conjugal transfer protein TraE [Proteus mirabilis]EKT9734389.1 conjugal transfer protein TraE [Proteus mirabilis]EKW6744471.1 conjugal transfer protein TraE [Proteus mirabilis]MBG5965316.1 conjugal transfer protein TraE [Proteus mirabilis]MBI6371442.1 conjugal transfer protein TraE [Proteus mirabilis]